MSNKTPVKKKIQAGSLAAKKTHAPFSKTTSTAANSASSPSKAPAKALGPKSKAIGTAKTAVPLVRKASVNGNNRTLNPAKEAVVKAEHSAAKAASPETGPKKAAPASKAAAAAPASKPSKEVAESPGKEQAKKSASSTRVPAVVAETETARGASTDDVVVPVVELVKPANQLKLSEKDLAEEFVRTLNAARPGPTRSVVRYNLEEKAYKPKPQLEQVLLHFTMEGCLLHRDGEEGQKLAKAHLAADEAAAAAAAASQAEASGKPEQGAAPDGVAPARQLRNQFNFSERGAQTLYYGLRARGTDTEMPPTAEMSGGCSHWEIYDAYIADQRQLRSQEEAQKQKGAGKGTSGGDEAPLEPDQVIATDAFQSKLLQKSLKVVERMSTQNTLLEVALDFKFWDDDADAVRIEEGTLLPLWKFSTALASHKQVTAVSWSRAYSDLFVAAFGSFDFQQQTSGLVAGFSLKNPSCPEFYVQTRPGIMSLQLHPQHSKLLAVGCYDGSVAVYDVKAEPGSRPLYASKPSAGKHSRPVWAVEWQAAQPAMPPSFHSLSSDGKVLLWTLATAELTCQEVMRLRQASKSGVKPDEEPSSPLLAAGCCIDFHPVQDFVYIVGTEEGAIYKCSTAYSTEVLLTYAGHDMAVYAVRWNQVHSATFLSSSADWTVKLWHADSPKAVMSFALGSPVGDVAWSPCSATVFAAVTDDGLARVFDVHQNAAEPLCEQKVVAKAGLTRLVFNPKHPVLLVGDNRGHLAVLKLSPNLRKYSKAETPEARQEAERAKLEAVLEAAWKSALSIERAFEHC